MGKSGNGKSGKSVIFAVAIAATLVTVFIWHTRAQTVINPGYDQFTTPANATTSETLSLPAGAITNAAGHGSEEFNGNVTFQGGSAVQGYTGDTVIERTQSVTVPGSTQLLVIGLNLVSVGTIEITFSDGTSDNYSVSVSQSSSTQSTGTMNFENGGSFTNSLNVNVEYTFTAPGEPTATFDAAANKIPAIAFTSSGTWTVNGGGSDLSFRRKLEGDLSERSNSGNPGGGLGAGDNGIVGPTGAAASTGGVNVSVKPGTETFKSASGSQSASHGITPAPTCNQTSVDDASSPGLAGCTGSTGLVKEQPDK